MVKLVSTQAELECEFKSAGERAVIVDFFATWCGPCKTIAPKIVALSSKYPYIVVLKVDVDKSEAMSTKYKIDCMPTFKVFLRGREVKGDTVESANIAAVEKLFKKYSPQ